MTLEPGHYITLAIAAVGLTWVYFDGSDWWV